MVDKCKKNPGLCRQFGLKDLANVHTGKVLGDHLLELLILQMKVKPKKVK